MRQVENYLTKHLTGPSLSDGALAQGGGRVGHSTLEGRTDLKHQHATLSVL